MFNKILIANRGEIACRVAATARRMGIQTVAVYSDADARALHVQLCDQAVHLGGNAPADSYLKWPTILAAAQSTGAQAIHPGYGFLSENEAFASACADAGLVFIGPPPSAIRAMGLKAASKQLMGLAGVPLVPGYHGDDQRPDLLQREADAIGYPVLIKASAGGGGKGMRMVLQASEFAAALASCQREARNSFGDDAVLIEKYVQRPRHIEIQVMGDQHGHVLHLFERDCSVQRRHQKVLEESPAPGMTAQLRSRMGAAAVAAAKAVNYVGAGTVEFIVEQSERGMDFFFMEMNTRLQVEHPVTEAITGLDLVEWQLRVAAGEPLGFTQDQLRIQGHAIEARICAENPERDFLPATGILSVYQTPDATAFRPGAVRLDSGVQSGDTISPYYDSMMAKLIVHADTREQALARMDTALSQMRIAGVPHNVGFLRHVVRSPSFAQAQLDTALIERERACLFDQHPVPWDVACALLVASLLADESRMALPNPNGWVDPMSQRNHWAHGGARARQWQAQLGDALVTLRYQRTAEQRGQLNLNADPSNLVFDAEMAWHTESDAVVIEWQGQRQRAHVLTLGAFTHVLAPQGSVVLQLMDPLAHQAADVGASGSLNAPMPGKVLSFAVKPGDSVVAGQALAVLEAMKMEHTIAAPRDGVVAELLFAAGDQVLEGASLLRLTD